MSEREMLAEHGTQLVELKPSTVLQAAWEDVRRHARNKEAASLGDCSFEQFAFHRRHVRKAVDALDLLVRAYIEPGIGLSSAKYNTRLLYSNERLLQDAIDLARRE
jgi:hypothetical protein